MTSTSAPAGKATGLRWLGVSLLVLTILLVMIDNTVLALAMPFISKDLDATAAQVLWIGDVYSFVLAGLLVSAGTLGDRIGRKKLLLIGASIFGLASIVAAYAPTAEALIGARALLGVGGATLMPSTLALIRTLFSNPTERRTAIGIWTAAALGGGALGPLVGGVLLEHFWWGSVFLINVPVVLLLIPAGAVLLPEAKNPDPGPWDLCSVALSMVGMIGVVYAVKDAVAHGVRPAVAVAAAVGVAALWLFVRRQRKLPRPLIDIDLFRNRAFVGVIGANMLSVFGMSGLMYFVSQYFQLVLGYSPLMAGLAGLPGTAGAIVVSLLAGVLLARISPRAVLAGGLVLMGVGTIPMALLTPTTSYLILAVSMVVIGVGMALVYTTANDIILSSVPKEKAGAAAAISETGYELGMALGIATLGSIVTAFYQSVRLPAGTSEDLARVARDSLANAVQVSQGMPAAQGQQLLASAQETFTSGLAVAAGVGAVLLLGASLLAWILLKHLPTS
ncbi:MFS transporter [Crossiella sp. SN42]|uniref:MFS transporter n=1 Tax=Crossiella sp. SN42 TaxID=2944808 RepID=UPI00207CC8BE|nr:MFS transporter [Crossiella sp. SN42]MCO1580517.1 MFS transporter [Crossiella sp. SN42]